MVSRETEEKFKQHCDEIRKIIEEDIEMFHKLMRERRSFKKEYKNAKKQMDLLEKLIEKRKDSYTIK